MDCLRRPSRPINGGCIVQPAVIMPAEERKSLRPRKRLPLSFILGGLAILAAVIYLVYANTQANAVYYMTVSELKNCTTCTTQSVRVAGFVQPGTIVRDDQKQLISFVITQGRSEEHTSELQSRLHLVCRLLLEKKKKKQHLHSQQTIQSQRQTY